MIEPVFFHAGPAALDEELVHDFSGGAIHDITPGHAKLRYVFEFWIV